MAKTAKNGKPDEFVLPEIPKPVKHIWANPTVESVRARLVEDYERTGPHEKGTKWEIGQLVQKAWNTCEDPDKKLTDKHDAVVETLPAMLETLGMYLDNETPYVFWHGRYVDDTKKKRRLTALKICIRVLTGNPKIRVPTPTRRDIIDDVESNHDPEEYDEDGEPDMDLIAFPNGYFSMSSGKMEPVRPHRQHWYIRRLNRVKYDPNAECPLFLKAFKSALQDEKSQSQLLDVMTLCLMPKKFNVFVLCICIGEGNNGKSKLLKFLQTMLGRGNFSAASLNVLKGDFGASAIIGKHANVCAEAQGGKIEAEYVAILRGLISGEYMNVNPKNKTHMDVLSTTTWVQACNTIPQIDDNTNAMHRRMVLIKFEQKFTETARWVDKMREDPNELSGVLNLLLPRIQGLMEREELEYPMSIEEVKATQEAVLDPVSEFITDMREHTDVPDEYVQTQTLTYAYKQYAVKRGYKQYAHIPLVKILEDSYGMVKSRVRQNGQPEYVWVDTKLKLAKKENED